MNMHKFLANAVVFAGFVAIPFIPLIVFGQSTFFPFITGKNFVFRIIVEIMLSAWAVLAIIDPAYRPRKSYIMGAFVALLGVISLSALLGENPSKSFWSNFERMEGVVTYFHLFAYFIVASTVLTVRNFWNSYLNLHLFAGVIMAVYAYFQWNGDLKITQDGFRVNGTLGNAAYLGTYALFNVFLALYLSAKETLVSSVSRVKVAIYGAVALFQIAVIYHTATRGAMLGLIAGLGLATLLVALFERERLVLRRVAIGILIALTTLVVGFIMVRDASFIKESPVLSRFSSISFTEQTTKSRFMVWGMAYEGFKEKPIIGWGAENFGYVFSKYYNPNMYDQEQWFDRAHNVFFDWLIAGGALGLLAYLSLFGFAVFYIWRRVDSFSILEKSILTGLLGGYFFQNLFVFDNLTSLIYFGTVLAYVDGMKSFNVPIENEGVNPLVQDGEDLTFLATGSALILAIVLIYTVNYKGFMQNVTLLRGLTERTSAGVTHNLELLGQAVGYGSFGTVEAREQLGQIAMSGIDRSKPLNEIQKQFVVFAQSELEKMAEEYPRDARALSFAGSYNARIGQLDKGLAYLERAREASPKKQAIIFELAGVYFAKGETAKAEELFKYAYELAPAFATAEKYYLQVLVANGKRAEAEKILKEHPLPGVSL